MHEPLKLWEKITLTIIISPITLSIIGIVMFLSYCWLDGSEILVSYDNYILQKKLSKRIKNGSRVIAIAPLIKFKWDKVCAYPPYSFNNNNDGSKWSLIFEKNDIIIHKMQVLRGITGDLDLEASNCGAHNSVIILEQKVLNGLKINVFSINNPGTK
jgi:hypothetical protein